MGIRTVGVEEEFLLLDATSPTLAPDGDAIVAVAAKLGGADAQFEHELKQPQAELGSPPATQLQDLAGQLRTLRAGLASAASRRGARVIAAATSPVIGASRTTAGERYRLMSEQFGLLARQQLTCGMHVHVAIESSDEGVAVLDRIRPWLALLTALSANSPFHAGQDSGFASYRSVLWGQWPTAGATAGFGDLAGYERLCRDLITTGAALDDGMIYFDARLSTHYPTLEVRVCDVCADVDDAVVIAGLVRALVSRAAADWRSGIPVSPPRPELLRAASWRAARWGMAGELVDLLAPDAPALVPAWELAAALRDYVADALRDTGDLALVDDGLELIRERGTGARRQRAAYGAGADLDAVLAAVTVPPGPQSS